MTENMPMQLLRAYIPFDMFVSIKDWVIKKPFKSDAESVRYFINLGMKMESLHENLEDPIKREQFINEMKMMVKNEQIYQWFETLEQSQLEAMSFFIDNEKERRLPKQRNL